MTDKSTSGRRSTASSKPAAKKPAAKKPAAKKPAAKKPAAKKPAAKKSAARAKAVGGKRTPAPRKKANREVCFVISPFGGWHDEYHREIFCEAINAVGLEPARADDLFTSTNIVHDIWHLVSKSRVMLADLTGKNPNVFYELGLAHAARKPVLLLAQSMDDVPFDLRALRVITYDVEHPAWGDVLRDAITQGLKETLESPERSVLPTFLLEDPKAQPRVTEDERRLLTIEQQLNSLAREVRAAPVPESRGLRDLRPNEALDRMQRYRAQGLPEAAIKRRLEARGVPPHWIEENLRRLEREEG